MAKLTPRESTLYRQSRCSGQEEKEKKPLRGRLNTELRSQTAIIFNSIAADHMDGVTITKSADAPPEPHNKFTTRQWPETCHEARDNSVNKIVIIIVSVVTFNRPPTDRYRNISATCNYVLIPFASMHLSNAPHKLAVHS